MTDYIMVVESISPLLQHRWAEELEVEETSRKVHIARGTPREEAEKVCYRMPSGQLYLPGTCFARMLREAAASHKQRSSRKSMKYVIPSAVLVTDDIVPLVHFDGKPITDFEVDSRPVVIPATKGRIMRHRPKIEEWRCEVHLDIDETLIAANFVQEIASSGGRQLGVGDFRPEKSGPYGRWLIAEWQSIKAPKPVSRLKKAA